MKYFSPLFSDARKKLGATVYARNRSGLIARAYVLPAQPRTADQVAQRAQFANLQLAWPTLTQQQRSSWNELALSTYITDSLGHRSHPSGLNLFISCNRNLAWIGQPQLNNAPASPATPPAPQPVSATITMHPPNLKHLYVTISPAVLGFPTNTVFACTPPLKPTINFIRGSRYRRLTGEVDSTGSTADLGGAYSAQFPPPTTGQRIAVLLRTVDPATGFSSPATRIFAVTP